MISLIYSLIIGYCLDVIGFCVIFYLEQRGFIMRKIRCKVNGEMDEICIFDDNVIDDNLDLSGMDLEELPDLSDITVTGSFNCANNYLSSLEGAPQHVGGSFDCSHNRLLKTLKDGPQFVGRDFICRGAVSLPSKSKLDLPKNIRGRCEIEYSEQESMAEQEVAVRGAYFSEEMYTKMSENIIAEVKQKYPQLFEITKTGETEKDTAENNSVSLAVKTKKKILDRARQKSK